MLKMKPEHYAILKAALDAISEEAAATRRAYQAAGLSPMRFRWDWVRAAKIEGNTMRWMCDVLYKYLNDNHIDSALKHYFAQSKETANV